VVDSAAKPRLGRGLQRPSTSHTTCSAQVPDPFNVFMNQSLSPKGELEVVEPLSRAGDYLTLRILTDCVVAVSACPNDQNRCNAGVITDLSLELFPEETLSV
jgi:uncharacterized protein YcgI (DUF1989 family)